MSLPLWGLFLMGATNAGERLLTDFTAAGADLGWTVVNDNVMGGRSDGGFRVEDGRLQFRGRTNTNGGGFSSIRSRPLTLDLSEYDGIRLRVKGDGRRYTWRLTTDATTRGRDVAYWASFDTRDGEWHFVDVPFERFRPRFRGSWLSGPELDPSTITSVGLMIYDGKDGDFAIELDRVAAYPKRDASSVREP